MKLGRSAASGRTSAARFQVIAGRTLLASSARSSAPRSASLEERLEAPACIGVELVWYEDLAESPLGAYWTPSSSGFHSGAAASLSSVLEPAASIPPKYYLSPTACLGILRRAAKRGRILPALLDEALRIRAGTMRISASPAP